MKRLASLVAFFVASALAGAQTEWVIVPGAGGDPQYQAEFDEQVKRWTDVANAAGVDSRVIPATEESRGALRRMLEQLPKDGDDLWLVLIGHGTFDGRDAKFNLVGDDITAKELGEWLKPFHRRVVVLGFFSASGAFFPEIAGPNRVVLTSTKSGGERNYSRLGSHFAASLQDPDADLDGDGITSLLDLARFANDQMVASYEKDKRIVLEHALLDDNGDAVGTEIRAIKHSHPPEVDHEGRAVDGAVAAELTLSRETRKIPPEFRERRAAIEERLRELRAHKNEMNERRYFNELEALLLEMAALYDTLEPQAE